jgi:hypothetical protein
VNTYEYVGGAPTMFVDPTGENPLLVGLGAGLASALMTNRYYCIQPNADARFDAVLASKLPVDRRLPLIALDQADRNGLQPVSA